MAKRQSKSSKAVTGKSSKKKSPHPGGSEEEAKAVGGKLDFGTAESDRTERTYTSLNTKRSDPGQRRCAGRVRGIPHQRRGRE